MASPGNDPLGKNKQTDPMAGMVPLADRKATVAELMKGAVEAQRGEQTKVDDPSTSRKGR